MRRHLPFAFAFALVAALAAPSAGAGLDVDLGVAFRAGDDSDLFFALSARYFDRDEDAVRRVARRVPDPDDVAVALFLSTRSRRPADAVLDLRARGLSWWDVSIRLGLEPDIWFLPVRHDPGPPYGMAYGHWKKRDPGHAWSLRDAEARDLVAVRVLHEYYGLDVEIAMARRAERDKVDALMARTYRERHGGDRASAPPTRDEAGQPGKVDDHAKGNGRGRGKGKSSR